MNDSNLARPLTSHIFAVGQAVRLKGNKTPQSQAGIYHVTGTMPPRGTSPQYRIRHENERHERVATQDELEAVKSASGSKESALIERTFGHG